MKATKPGQFRYECRHCKRRESQFRPQCPACLAWDAMLSITPVSQPGDPAAGVVRATDPVKSRPTPRVKTGFAKFDSVMGGGHVRGVRIALPGSPGAMKSRLCLHIASAVAKGGERALYVCGEEEVARVQTRLADMGLAHENIGLTAVVEASALCELIVSDKPRFVLVDSANTLYDASSNGRPGSPSQLAASLVRVGGACQSRSISSLFIAHLNAKGVMSGPRFFEHMTDVVLYMKKAKQGETRVLYPTKNRDGSTAARSAFEVGAEGTLI